MYSLGDGLVEISVVVWPPEVGNSPVVVEPEVGRASRAHRAKKVISPLGPEISRNVLLVLVCSSYVMEFTCPAPVTRGGWSRALSWPPGCCGWDCNVSRSRGRLWGSRHSLPDMILGSLTWTRDTDSPCRACFRRRSCTLPGSMGFHRRSSETICVIYKRLCPWVSTESKAKHFTSII